MELAVFGTDETMFLDLRCMGGRSSESPNIGLVQYPRALCAADLVGGYRVDLTLKPVGPALAANVSGMLAKLREDRKDGIG